MNSNKKRGRYALYLVYACVKVTRSNAATIRVRKVCLVSRVSVWNGLDQMLHNQREEGMPCISCESVEVTRSNAATIGEREACLVSRVNVWKLLDRLLQQSKRGRYE